MIKSVNRHREFTGPTPHSVAIIARPPNKKPAEHLILERRRIEDLREKSIAETQYIKQCDLKSAWEQSTDKRIQKNVIKRQMENFFQKENIVLEKRREKLRELLLAEEESYIQEMEDLEETTEQRQEKMKKRAKFLKEKRETERLATVQDKLDQKFREECEELRAEQSRRTRDAIFRDRDNQLLEKRQLKQQEQQTERFYAHLWEKDTKAKEAREEFETQQQIERNKAALEVLNLQKTAIEVQKVDEMRMKQMEADWLKEEAAMRKYEEEQLKAEKQQKQKSAKKSRDISIKLKQRKEAKEKQEQIAMDMKMLNRVIQETQNQQQEDINKKKEQREEMERFMHYVDKYREEETEREKELETIINAEVENQWKINDAKKRTERQARKALLGHVMATREEQKKERERAMKQEQEEAMKERLEMLSQMEEHRKLEAERINHIRNQNLKYQNDLEEQIAYQRYCKDLEIEQARKELGSLQNAELDYQRKLRKALDSPDQRKMHPLRLRHMHQTNRLKTC